MSQQNSALEDAHRELYRTGEQMRRQVLGDAWVNASTNPNTTEFMTAMQKFATEVGWSHIWTRPGLELKQRSLVVITILSVLGKEGELAAHLRGAVKNGCTELEIQEALLHIAAYCGIPQGLQVFRVADRVIKELKEEGLLPKAQ